MNKNELQALVRRFQEESMRIDMTNYDLPGIDFSDIPGNWAGAYLNLCDLAGTNFDGMDLHYVDMRRSSLRYASLIKANLMHASLEKANLTCANLSYSDLRFADLDGANLTDAVLTGVDLYGATGPFAFASFGKHTAVAAGGWISIGCQRYSYDQWLADGYSIGSRHFYSQEQMDIYMKWVRMAIDWLEPL